MKFKKALARGLAAAASELESIARSKRFKVSMGLLSASLIGAPLLAATLVAFDLAWRVYWGPLHGAPMEGFGSQWGALANLGQIEAGAAAILLFAAGSALACACVACSVLLWRSIVVQSYSAASRAAEASARWELSQQALADRKELERSIGKPEEPGARPPRPRL